MLMEYNSSQIPQNPDTQSYPVPANKTNQTLIFVIVILLLIIVGGGGFILAKYFYSPKPASDITTQQPVINQPTANSFSNLNTEKVATAPASIGETANWKTYLNASLGFTLHYPPDWINNDTKGGEAPSDELLRTSFGTPKWFYVTVIVTDNNCGDNTTKQCLLPDTNGYEPSGLSIQDTSLGGQPAYLVLVKNFSKLPYGYEGTDRSIITSYKGKIYRVYLGLNKTTQVSSWSDKEYTLFNQILSTFKFL